MKTSLNRAREYLLRRANDRRFLDLAQKIRQAATIDSTHQPVLFFNASTRLGGVSLNAGFASLAAMSLQLEGIPVHFFGCRQGLERCTLGALVNGPENPPPCDSCIRQSRVLYASASTHWLAFDTDPALDAAIADKSTFELKHFEFEGIPLGELTLPSLRWTLRIHHLADDAATRNLFKSFIRSAFNLVRKFQLVLDETDPQCVVVFNGISYPEAAARWAAQQRGIRVITHEVAHQPMTAFFSHDHVTAYPVDIPEAFELNDEQNQRLDTYLQNRFQGNFSMAGLKFWPEMRALDDNLLHKIEAHEKLVSIFTNVIFDTSQVHANVIFEHMFAWLDQILEIIKAHPETLFVIRAHPDELRPKSRKQAVEKVDDWIANHKVCDLPNVVYIPPLEYLSSYALIQRSHFVMAYNSTIGLEAALMGKTVLNGGKARYTQYPCVHLPSSAEEHRSLAENLLSESHLEIPEAFRRNARRFQYYQLWRTPLPFNDFLEAHLTRGYVQLKNFEPDQLVNATTMQIIRAGILDGAPFLMPDHPPDPDSNAL